MPLEPAVETRAQLQRRLLDTVAAYAGLFPEDAGRAAVFTDFLKKDLDWLSRLTQFGHLTASAWVLGPDKSKAALINHRKLQRWLQPGGHADGDGNLLAVALREVEEETGLVAQAVFDPAGGTFVRVGGSAVMPFDLDAHEIPAAGGFPAHIHFDFRYLLIAQTEALGPGDSGVTAVRWFSPQEVESIDEEGIRRMAGKAAKHAGNYQLYSTV